MNSRQSRMQDVATAAGVHRTTVSRALRNDPALPAETRQKIQQIARKLGYTPNPLVSALMSVRAAQRPAKYQATLAFVSHHPDPRRWERMRNGHDRMFAGARERAREFGYRLEVFWRTAPGMTAERFSRILRARRINGVVIAPSPDPTLRAELDWSDLCGVELGYNLAVPDLHRACHDYFHSMITALQQLRLRGYRRIGFALRHSFDRKVHHLWHAAFVHEQLDWPARERVRPLLLEELEAPLVHAWLDREQPDAVVGIDWPFFEKAILETGRKTPRDIGLANLACDDTDDRFAGIYQGFEKIGAAGVEMLIASLQRNECGLPPQAHSLLIKGVWRDGPTLRARPA